MTGYVFQRYKAFGQGENNGYQHINHFSQGFQKLSSGWFDRGSSPDAIPFLLKHHPIT